jgi:hypothetical protein
MSNGKIVVIRSAGDFTYSLSSILPSAMAICNYNGQVIIGAPDVNGLGANLVLPSLPITVTVSQLGEL